MSRSTTHPPRLARYARLATLALTLTAVSALAGTAAAQPASETVKLSSSPYLVDGLNLRVYLPIGAAANTENFGTNSVTTIRPNGDLGTISIQSRKSKDETLTAQDLADAIIKSRRRGALLTRNPGLQIGERPADRFYMKAPGDRSGESVMWGFTVIELGQGEFAILELIVDEPRFADARKVYEATVATATVIDEAGLAETRSESLSASSELLKGLTPDQFEQALAKTNNRWERLYTPSTTGQEIDAVEHGYRRLKAWRGQRGELTEGKPRSNWSATERTPGYIVQIDAKLLDSDFEIHTEAIYFLSEDRRDEAWTIRMALRDGPKPSVWVETGVRTGANLTVSVRQGSLPANTVQPQVTELGYLSVLETHVLAPLLLAAEQTGDFDFVTYQSSSGTIAQRSDTIAPTNNGFAHSTTHAPGASPQVARYRDDGALIRVEQPDGRVWEPIDQNRLVRLWEAKGLLED